MAQLKAAHDLSVLLADLSNREGVSMDGYVNIALSGGSSPLVLFRLWRSDYSKLINWKRLRCFWVDERMVPADSEESNYGNAKRELLDHVPLAHDSVYRIDGEQDPEEESLRYSNVVTSLLPLSNGFPVFDLVLLGIGDDGHTSSIFPGQSHLLNNERAYAASVNPYSGQSRIAMTGRTILSASRIAFYLKGAEKASVLEKVNESKGSERYPAAYIIERATDAQVFFDKL
jgi:6-phosphogluconolactonase